MLSSKHQEEEVAMSKRLKCPECGADQDDIRYVCETTEYHYIDEVLDDGCVELRGIERSEPQIDFSFICMKCDCEFGIDGKPVEWD